MEVLIMNIKKIKKLTRKNLLKPYRKATVKDNLVVIMQNIYMVNFNPYNLLTGNLTLVEKYYYNKLKLLTH
jgi:hypothetical protein